MSASLEVLAKKNELYVTITEPTVQETLTALERVCTGAEHFIFTIL